MSTNFPVSLDVYTTLVDNTDDVLAVHANDRGDAIEAVEAKLGIDGSADTNSVDYLLKNAASVDPGHSHSAITNFLYTGNTMWFYLNTAPTGWTIVAVTDSVLAVKGGAQAYNVTGGQTAGTWTQPDHTLIENEIPSHKHRLGTQDSTAGDSSTPSQEFVRSYGSGNGPPVDSELIGGGAVHNHGTTYRTMAAVGIVASKD